MVSPARTAALVSYFAIECIVAVVLYFILEVPRVPLPRDEIGALVQAVGNSAGVPWPQPHISVSALPEALSEADLRDFVQQLTSKLAAEGVQATVVTSSAPELHGLGPCTAKGHGSIEQENAACLAAMEQLTTTMPNDGGSLTSAEFHLVVVPSQSCSTLFLDADTSAILRWQRGGKGVEKPEDLARLATSRLLETWFKQLPLFGVSPLFEIAPSYLFSFFLVSDCTRRVAWDFEKDVFVPYLRGFMGRLHTLFDFDFDSQVVQCSSLKGSASHGTSISEVDVEDLKADFLQNAGEWPGDTVTTDARWLPPLVRLAAFWPSTPLRVLDAEQQPQRAFAVPGWGAVALAGGSVGNSSCVEEACSMPASAAQHLSPCEAQRVASAWVSMLRAWLTLRPEGASPATADLSPCEGLTLLTARPHLDGIARWEQLLVAKIAHTFFLRRSAETLENFMALVDSLPDLEISAEIGEVVSKAAAAAQKAISEAGSGNLNEAMREARLALRLSLTASHDDTVVAQMYFSWQFKWAVYLPLLLPIVVPTLVGLFRELKRRKPKAATEVPSEEVQ